MKWLVFAVLIVVGLFAVLYFIYGEEVETDDTEEQNDSSQVETTEVEEDLTQPELAARALEVIGNDGVYVIDVRTEAEWQAGHVDGAVWWGLEEELRQGNMPSIASDSQVYIYCRSGNRSAEATGIMRDNGFTNVFDVGAFTTMTEAGAEVATGDIVLP